MKLLQALVAAAAVCGASASKHVLVLLDPLLLHAIELPDDYVVTHADYTNDSTPVFLGEQRLYDDLVFLPLLKRAVANAAADRRLLLSFFEKGGNVLVVQDSADAVPEEVRLFLAESGIHAAPRGHAVGSHFGSVALGDEQVVTPRVFGSLDLPHYEGSAALLSNNRLLVPLVRAPKLSFCASAKELDLTAANTWTYGEQGFLAAGLQGLNNARLAWVGAPLLVSDELKKWVFQEKNVLKLVSAVHHPKDTPIPPKDNVYAIKNDVFYQVSVSELKDGEWVPFVPETPDDVLQVSFKMLDPYQRVNMSLAGLSVSSDEAEKDDVGVFLAQFRIPDHHGMFTFDFDYKRTGYSFLSDKQVVTVRHLANDEYKRSWEITNAWVYVASALCVIVAWFLFVVNFLFLQSEGAKVEKVTVEKVTVEKVTVETEKAKMGKAVKNT